MIAPPPPPRWRVIIAGSRNVSAYASVQAAVKASGWTFTEVVSGTARGVDQLGERYAAEHGLSVRRFPANWDAYGARAGRMRNSEMAHYADALIAVWDGRSPGTKHMIDVMRYHDKPTFVYRATA